MANWPEFRLKPLLVSLASHGVDFVVIGGIAAIAHGSPKLTKDLDICYATDDANLEALAATLGELNARLRGVTEDLPFAPDASTLRLTEVLTLETDQGWLDLLARPAGSPAYERLRRRAERVDLEGVSVLVASIDDLIEMKLAAGRDRDVSEVEELKLIRRLRKRVGPSSEGS